MSPEEQAAVINMIIDDLDEYTDEPTTDAHVYLSTACYHGEHDYCNSMTGQQGEKRPATCKWCDARCVCPCHQDERDRVHAIALERDRRISSWAKTGLGGATSATPASAGEPKATNKDLQS